MNEDLPSINDFIEDRSNLPSLNESVESDLPSYKDFIEERVEEVVADIDDQYSHHFEQSQPAQAAVQTDLSSVITLIEGVRNSIPEVKSYDKELYQLMTLIEELRSEIPEIPEIPDVKYYDKEIQELKESIPTIPEVKYYDEEIKELKESINEVKDRYIPDFRWINKSFNQLDEGQETLTDTIGTLKENLEIQVKDLIESVEVSKFESGIDNKSVNERVDATEENIVESKRELIEVIEESKKKIYKEMRDSSLKIWELNKQYKSDSKKLKEETLSEYKELKENLESSLQGITQKTDHDFIQLNEFFESLKKQVGDLPKVKYYDEDIDRVERSVKNVQSLVEVLEEKLNKKIEDVKEGLLNIPPSEDNSDPLTPLDQNFVTIDELQSHYRTFVNRVQQQLSTLGGGGEVRLEFLDDVDRDTAKVDGKFLKYESSSGKWVGASASGATFSGTAGQFLQHNGSEFVGVGSTAVTDTIRNASQGFYGYTTDFYTVGTANTTQDLGEDEFTLVQPQVAVGGTYSYLPTRMHTCNNGNPWVGTGATIGTGQTEFSLAGTIARSTVLVRFAYDFIPDVDDSDLDLRLHFTTNTDTQGTGLTNFNIDKQGLVCNVGAGITYGGENLISFFVGETLAGDTKDEAGRFCVQANASDGGTLEVKALNIIVDV